MKLFKQKLGKYSNCCMLIKYQKMLLNQNLLFSDRTIKKQNMMLKYSIINKSIEEVRNRNFLGIIISE